MGCRGQARRALDIRRTRRHGYALSGLIEAIKTVVSSKPEWHEFAVWLENSKALVDTKRGKLDYVLPEDLVPQRGPDPGGQGPSL